MLLQILMWLGGIAITLLVFIISYRKTIGARIERVKSANKEIVAILARSIANPKIDIDRKTVQSVIRSKSREYNVSVDDLNDMFMILEDVMTKYIENEFISEEIRNTLVGKIKELLKEKDEPKLTTSTISDLSRDRLRILMSTLSATIAMVGVMVASLGILKPELSKKVEFPTSLLIAMMASIAIATLMAFMKLAIERQKKIRNEAIYKGPMLEETVLSALEEHYRTGAINQEMLFWDGKKIDFVVELGDEKIPVEVKYILDSKSISRAFNQLQEFIKRLKAKKGLLLVNGLVSEKDKKTALDSKIFIIENAGSKPDIIRQLQKID